jgi:tetratricopeptide (TPR) repeat protein
VNAHRLASLVLAAIALAPVALAPAPAARAAGPTREEALAALADKADPESRRHGAQALAETGLMADVPRLAAALRDVDPVVRAFAESAMWQVWSRSGDASVDRLFSQGVAQMNASQGEQAVDTFSEIIRRRPDFAEGWNKRATVYYLLGEYKKSLADCDEVMKRNPYHFGALSGYGLIYLQLDQPAKALEYFERALAVNPNLESTRQTIEMLRTLLIQRRKDTI